MTFFLQNSYFLLYIIYVYIYNIIYIYTIYYVEFIYIYIHTIQYNII